ncbi:hypothetical protein ACO2Q0_03050 [Phenylobacterium sp. VNQ135]|uniref:hypothetical protein n=1 Tax=Phenylobacterium sp. VNQ135 TaxID=3400922 RepID=UPI003C10C79D
MARYLAPSVLLSLGLVLWAAQEQLPWPNVPFAAMLVYAVGAVWWAIVAAGAPPPFLRHALAAWVPALPLAFAFIWIQLKTGFDGPGALMTLVLLPLLVVVLLSCILASMTLGLRKA